MNQSTKEEDMYAEIGIKCPYLLAKHQGVKLTAMEDNGEVIAYYSQTTSSTYRVFMNLSIDIESQEMALHLLLKHHNSENKGMKKFVLKRDLRVLSKIEREIKKYNNLVVDIFLKGSVFNQA